MHHFFLVLLHNRQLVYLFCAIIFTLGAVSIGVQPYLRESYSVLLSIALMVVSVIMGFSYTSFLRHFAPHKALHR